MAVFKINKNKDYVVMSNYHLKEKAMSLKAKGLLSLMLSLPDNWNYSIDGLVSICKEEESSINGALKELKMFGYLKVDKIMPNQTQSGRYEYVYNIYEMPNNQAYEKQEVEKQGVENQGLEFLGLENHSLNNSIKELSIKELSIKDKILKNKERKKEESYDDIIERLVTDDELKEKLKAFIQMRKLIKEPLTNNALELLINKLFKMTRNPEEQIEIINQSIINNWRGLFPVKDFIPTKPIPIEDNEAKNNDNLCDELLNLIGDD